MKHVDCAVLGLGAMGSAAVYHLSKFGQQVLGLEQFALGHAQGSSHGHSRAFRVFYHDPLYTELAKAALPIWQDLEKQSNERLLYLNGFLAFANPQNKLLERNLKGIRSSGADFDVVTDDEISQRFPSLSTSPGAIGCYTPHAGFLDASKCVLAHLKIAEQYGADLRENVKVQEIQHHDDSTILSTSEGDFRVARLVVTAGPWSASCLNEFELPLRVTRQQKFYFQPDCDDGLGPDSLPVYADYDTQFYGFPLHGGGVKVADDSHGFSTTADTIDRRLDEAKRSELEGWLKRLFPDHTFRYFDGSTCMYTLTPSEDFLVGPHPDRRNVFIAAGFSGHGFKFSTLIGKILAELVIYGRTDYPIDRFRLDRSEEE